MLTFVWGLIRADNAPPLDESAHLMESNTLPGATSPPADPVSALGAAEAVAGMELVGDAAIAEPATMAESGQATLASATVAATTAAGRTPGSFGVSTSGAATYRIPLWVPPGVGHVELDLAFAYNSRAGNGVMGQGWSLAGLSAISRCNKSWAQDGAPAPVTNTPSDRYCLDGQQLKLVSGTSGAPGAVYATEIEAFSRIVANGTAGGGPASFTVTTKNGLVYEYGTTVDSQIYAGSTGTIRTWALSHIRDRALGTDGNAIAVKYVNDSQNGMFRVSEINYPYTTTGQGPFYRVSFSYSSRPTTDPVVGYVTGNRVQELNQLDSVTITDLANGGTIKSYSLSYSQGAASSRLQLTSVQECSATTCLAPTTMTYLQGTKGWVPTATSTGVNASYKAATLPVDMNGDGITDLLYPVGEGNSVMHWWLALGQAGGNYGSPIDTSITADASVTLISGHFLGNGRAQVLVPQGNYWSLISYSGTAVTKYATNVYVDGEIAAGDIDGDGLDDLVSTASNSTGKFVHVRRNITSPFQGQSVATFAIVRQTIWTLASNRVLTGLGSGWQVADLNGDGRADITVYSKLVLLGTYYMQPLLSNGFGTAFTVGIEKTTSGSATFAVADWNADGCSDLLDTSKVLISNCAGDFSSVATGATSIVGTAILPLDWDLDGRSDLVYLHKVNSNNNEWYVVRSTGTGAFGNFSSGVAAPQNTAWFAFDKDGDGTGDLAWRDDRNNGNGRINYQLHQSPGAPADVATGFTDGFGKSQNPDYISIATGNYTKEVSATFPETDFQGPLYVVRQVSSSDGTGGTYQTVFHYYGARSHVQGRGFEGFHTQRTYDSRNGIYTFEFFQQAFPYTGMRTQRTSQPQATGSLKVSEWTATVSKQVLGTGFEQRVFPFVSAEVDARYEVGGALDGQLVTQATDSYAYDDGYGNVNVHSRTVTDKDATSPYRDLSWQSTVNTSYTNDPATNCIGLPSSVTESQSTPGQTGLTRTSSYSVDIGKCRVWQQVLQGGTPALKVTTTLGFEDDDCGNTSSIQIIGSNPDGTSMTARTTGIDYGSRCQFPESLTNALGQTSTVVYRYDFGVPQSVKDPNNLVTGWQYDDFGRRVLETRPDLTTTAWSFESCSAGPCWGQNDLRFHVYETSKGSANDIFDQREQFFDELERLRLNEYMRVMGAWVTETIQYDSLGRAVRRDRPTSGASNGYEALTYDLLNRITARKLYQSGGSLDRTYLFEYSGRTASTTDPLGHKTTRITDVAGRMRRVIDPLPGGTTSFDYDSFGNLIRIQDAIGAVSTGTYNLRGFRTQWADADRGTWDFTGNSLNELVGWSDAKGQSFSAIYDVLGRMTSRTEPDGTSYWVWGSSATGHNIGSLLSKSGYGYAESLTYDSVGRPLTRTITTDQTYQFDYAYNSAGALDTLTYPTSPIPAGRTGSRFKVRYAYSYGEPVSITDLTDVSTTLWTLNGANDYSSATSETFGANVRVTSGYKAWTNEITGRQAGVLPATTNRQNLAYLWDTAGNLSRRQDVNQALTEEFTMDSLDRISSSTLNGQPNLSVSYDASGNVTSRSDAGTLIYGSTSHPHAVTSAGGHTYTYDANGNQITRDGASQAWASFNLPIQLAQPIDGTTYLSQFSYGPDHRRWKQVAAYSNGTEMTYYVGGLLEKESPAPSGATQWRHYVYTPSGAAVLVTRDSAGATATRYLLTDHLGSSDTVLDPGGNVIVRESFAAFGARRGSDWSSAMAPDWTGIANTSRHGFTGHEHLDNLLLVHMNGRVYDPGTGRFLSVDPLVGDFADSQQINPYAYVGNRPLGVTDPSGLCPQCVFVEEIFRNVIFATFSSIIAGGGGEPPPPPASVMTGQSAQSGMNMCGPGQSSGACTGVVLYQTAPVAAGEPFPPLPGVIVGPPIYVPSDFRSGTPGFDKLVFLGDEWFKDIASGAVNLIAAMACGSRFNLACTENAKTPTSSPAGEGDSSGNASSTPPDPDDDWCAEAGACKPNQGDRGSMGARPRGVPENWIEQPGRKGGHTKWVNPANQHDYVRVKPDGTVTQVRNGKAFDAAGNAVDLDAPEAHGISLDEFIFRE